MDNSGDKFFVWLKDRKKVISQISDDSLRKPLLDLHDEYVTVYIAVRDEKKMSVNDDTISKLNIALDKLFETGYNNDLINCVKRVVGYRKGDGNG